MSIVASNGTDTGADGGRDDGIRGRADPNPTTPSDRRRECMARGIFDQRERWLEELRQHVSQDASVICEAGYMSLPAITQEIAEAALDPQPHDQKQKYAWISRARDLDDSLSWTGSDLAALVTAAVHDLNRAITHELLTDPSKLRLDDSKRSVVAKKAATLGVLLDSDVALVAAWRDSIAACKNPDHTEFPTERVKYFRDTVFALCHRRKQDLGAFGQLRTAFDVLLGSDYTVRSAQRDLGDGIEPSNLEIGADSTLTSAELQSLSERCIVAPTRTGDYVVWFRIDHAFVKGGHCVSHGVVTFYPAMSLARALTNHNTAHQLYEVVPQELLTEQVRESQLSEDYGPNDYRGFEKVPGLVYARVEVDQVGGYLARSRARTLLDSVLKVIGTNENTWEVLGGSLLFGRGERFNYHSLEWGPKHDFVSHELDYLNDRFTESLEDFNNRGVHITADAAEALNPVLDLQDELRNAPETNPETVVRAAVRSIEHCNTWTEGPSLDWADFVTKYLLDYYTVEKFAHRAVVDVFQAAVAYVPDHSPGATRVAELREIAEDISENKWDGPIIRAKTVVHTAALRRIYQDHWLARSLAEIDDTLATPAALAAAFAKETQQVEACTDRLRRTRNAAIHGRPVSAAACATIAEFARRVAGMALINVIEAVIDGVDVEAHTLARRTRYRTRVENLTQLGNLDNLFTLPSSSP